MKRLWKRFINWLHHLRHPRTDHHDSIHYSGYHGVVKVTEDGLQYEGYDDHKEQE